MATRSKPASIEDLERFHRDVLDLLLSFCAKRGIKTREPDPSPQIIPKISLKAA